MNPSPSRLLVLAGITTHNRAHVLPKALDSLRRQGFPDLAVTVLDDASTDGTPDLRTRYPEFRWLRHDEARGIIESRNELMRSADADFFLCLDDDAWFLRGDEISLAVARLQAEPAIAGIAFDILSPDRPAIVERAGPRPASMFIGCGHVLRLSAISAAGFYAPSPGTYGSEEKDLCLRLSDLGHRIELLPGVHVWHDKAWTGRDNNPLHRSGVCNEMVMTLRRCPLPDAFLVLPLKVVSYLWFWLRNPNYMLAGLAGLGDFLRHLGGGWRARQPVRRSTFWRFRRMSR